jgi:hypothetical protein
VCRGYKRAVTAPPSAERTHDQQKRRGKHGYETGQYEDQDLANGRRICQHRNSRQEGKTRPFTIGCQRAAHAPHRLWHHLESMQPASVMPSVCSP